jgi:hypothetical protein|uniref:Uncharacterized protein n=1 Tax=Siphoviridae sp. ct1SN28 TaxID=2825308 RepID=A0A8S5TRK1_9CAUD|nr:MAG TPA: hypothetical protein [Siphoviridae sp. ct1SN28]
MKTAGNNTSRSVTIIVGALLSLIFAMNATTTTSSPLAVIDMVLSGTIGLSMLYLALKGDDDEA